MPLLRSLAIGSSGAYVGAKDYLISEIVGGFSATADCGPSAHKGGGKVGRLTLQVGAHAAPPPPGYVLCLSADELSWPDTSWHATWVMYCCVCGDGTGAILRACGGQ